MFAHLPIIKRTMSKHFFEIKFPTLGQLSTEILVILLVLPHDFPHFSLIYNDFISKFMNI